MTGASGLRKGIRVNMRQITAKHTKYILAALTFACVLVPSHRVFAAETAPEGRPGAAFGVEEDSQDSSNIISDYSSSSLSDYSTDLSENHITLGNSVYYDELTGRYIYDTDIGTVEATVMDGMIVTDTVIIVSDNSSSLILYKDGERLPQQNDIQFSDSGYYVIQYNDNNGISDTILEFTIVPELTGMVDSYVLPDGFSVTEATYNGRDLSLSSTIDMSREGKYHIVYQCDRTKVAYTLDVELDHTAPVLALEAVTNGVAKGPVDISDLEEGATIAITMDGKNYNYREKLTESGNYEITVTDAAGNESSYQFTIRIYLDSSAYVSILIVLLILAGVAVYMVVERKKLRTR